MRHYPIAILVLGLVSTACSWNETKEVFEGGAKLEVDHGTPEASDRAVLVSNIRWIRQAADSKEGAGAKIEVTLSNAVERTLWVRLRIDLPRALGGCENLYEVPVKGLKRVECPQSDPPPEDGYSVEVTAYKDFGQSDVYERVRYSLRFDSNGDGILRSQ